MRENGNSGVDEIDTTEAAEEKDRRREKSEVRLRE